MSELKPCPFCGESKLLYSGGCGFRYDDDDNQIRLFRVHCRTCKGRTGLFESLDEAVEAWNRRTNSTTIQPEPHWIPVTESCECDLMDNEEVLVCQKDGQIRHAMYDDFYEKKKFVTWEEGITIYGVVAYMPLPEPFKGVME